MKVAVIGGGAVGLCLARELSHGSSVTVYEEDGRIGSPVHCSGVISRKGLELIGASPKKCVQNKVRGARLFSPGGMKLEVERKDAQAYVLDRGMYDRELADVCESRGVRIQTGKRIRKREEVSGFDYVACCEGVHANFTKSLGLETKRDFAYCFQREGRMKDVDTEKVELYFGGFARGFFGWLIPLGDSRVRAGLGVSHGNPKQWFESFAKKYNINARWETDSGGLIPLGGPIPRTVLNNICIIGDAAGQVKSTTGGGVIFGSLCAGIAAECMKEGRLADYEKGWRKELGSELRAHAIIRDMLNRFTDRGYDRLFRVMKKTGFEETLESMGDMDFSLGLLRGMLKKPLQTAGIASVLPLCIFP